MQIDKQREDSYFEIIIIDEMRKKTSRILLTVITLKFTFMLT